jgi:hypothetical protein
VSMRTEEEKKCNLLLVGPATDGQGAKVSKRERWFSSRTTWDCAPRFLAVRAELQYSSAATSSKWHACSARDDGRTLLRTLRQREQFCRAIWILLYKVKRAAADSRRRGVLALNPFGARRVLAERPVQLDVDWSRT